ncbi:hypothetical protein T12_12824, partial [Trichinella patagoniensis]
MELLYSHIVKILTEDDLILSKTFQETFLTFITIPVPVIQQLKELEIKVILPKEFRDEGITQRFIKWLLGDRAVEGLLQFCVYVQHEIDLSCPFFRCLLFHYWLFTDSAKFNFAPCY